MLNENDKVIRNKDSSDSSSLSKISANLIAKENWPLVASWLGKFKAYLGKTVNLSVSIVMINRAAFFMNPCDYELLPSKFSDT